MLENGHLLKEKKEYLIERFTILEGLFDFFIVTSIWGFLITKYNQAVFDKIFTIFSDFSSGNFQLYLTYLGLGFFYSMLGLGISYIVITLYGILFKR